MAAWLAPPPIHDPATVERPRQSASGPTPPSKSGATALVINKAIGNLIRDEKTIQIRSAIQTGAAHGMCLLEQSLNEMVRAGQITRDEALRIAEDKKLITA